MSNNSFAQDCGKLWKSRAADRFDALKLYVRSRAGALARTICHVLQKMHINRGKNKH